MNTQLLGVALTYAITLALAIPFGRYIAKIFSGERSRADAFFGPIERLFFRISRIDPQSEMTWKESMKAMLALNIVWFIWVIFCLLNQGWLPLNPDGNPSQSPDQAFNTAISGKSIYNHILISICIGHSQTNRQHKFG